MSIAPFNTSVLIATKGTAVQLSATSLRMRHCSIIAYDDNQGDIYIGIGSGTSTTKGTYFRKLRPGDEREFMSQHLDICIDLSDFWINNSAGADGFNNDGEHREQHRVHGQRGGA